MTNKFDFVINTSNDVLTSLMPFQLQVKMTLVHALAFENDLIEVITLWLFAVNFYYKIDFWEITD